jgi:26S proteasome regulatory subunit T2
VLELFRVAFENSLIIVFIEEIDVMRTKCYGASTGGERDIQRTMLELPN